MPMGNIQMTEEQFQQALSAASEAGARAAVSAVQALPQPTVQAPAKLGPGDLPINPEEAVTMLEEHYARATARPVADRTPHKLERVPCRSVIGSTFTAVVATRSGEKFGTVVRLEDYKEPEFVSALESGSKPGTVDASGRFVLAERQEVYLPNSRNINPKFRLWQAQTFWQKDLKTYVGQDIRTLEPIRVREKAAA